MTATSRDGRRRRMLHEGATTPVASEAPSTGPATRARYTPREGSVSFAAADSLLPRTPLAWLACLLGLGGVIAMLGWGDQFGVAMGGSGAAAAAKRLLLVDKPGSLAVWWETLLWAAVAIQAVLLFGLRKHRTDDTRGAYRWWLVLAGIAMGTSLATATTATTVVASQLAAVTGFSPLAADAFWWLVPGTMVTFAVGLRSLLEVKESPLAAVAGVSALVCLAVSGLAGAGLVPEALAAVWPRAVSPLVAPLAGMAGASLTLVGLSLYARRIVREALGEVAPPRPIAQPSETAEGEKSDPGQPQAEVAPTTPRSAATPKVVAAPPAEETAYGDEESEEPAVVETPAARRAKKRRERQATKKQAVQQQQETQWVSGPEADDEYDDEGPKRRKLTKAERKRLRREKARHAA